MRWRCVPLAALFALCTSAARAQPVSAEEVPYVRTPQAVVDKMLDLAEVGVDDFLIDLGSGDGRIVITAARQRGARGFGVELDSSLVEASNEAARKAGVDDRARFFARDLFDTDIHEATVLTMYLLPSVNIRLRPRLLAQLKPGTRVVSHDWDMGEWRADAKAVLQGQAKPVMPMKTSTVYLWIVPAKVAGTWKVQLEGEKPESMEIEFTQRFQEIDGVATRTRGRTLFQSAHLRGPEIRFALIDETRRPSEPLHFFGRVYGDTMEGTTGSGVRWHAERMPRQVQGTPPPRLSDGSAKQRRRGGKHSECPLFPRAGRVGLRKAPAELARYALDTRSPYNPRQPPSTYRH